MRVVAGSAKGRRIDAPAGDETRPTSDRVREATFNELGSRCAVAGARVLDLYAGSGAMGIEALSRGAAHCVFVDRSPQAAMVIRSNLERCGLADRAKVVVGDVLRWCRERRAVDGDRVHEDLALCDPPYDFDDWGTLLDFVPAELVVIESDRAVEVPDAYRLLQEKRYGTTVVRFIRREETTT